MSTGRAHSYAGDISPLDAWKLLSDNPNAVLEIGRASCRETVYIKVVAV